MALDGSTRIVFEPGLDRGVLADGERATVGRLWLGETGFLGRLETELGLGGLHLPTVERACVLAASLAARAERPWWGASFAADAQGTARRLLADRDRLALARWRGQPAGPRLDELHAATAGAPAGVPDRLRAVIDAVARHGVDLEHVTLLSPARALPPLWRDVLAALAAAGVTVALAPPPSGVIDLARVSLLRPRGPLAAADEVAGLLAAGETGRAVVLAPDEILDDAFARHGLPRLGASGPAAASTAIIPLVLEAIFEPMEPADLHALICLDPGPVPRRIASLLVEALRGLPGRRTPAWRAALAEGLARCDESWRGEVAARLEALLMPAARRDGRVAAAEVLRRLRVVSAWARARELLAPARLAERLARVLGLAGAPSLSAVELRRLGRELDDEQPVRHAAQAGAGLAAVGSPAGVLAPVDTVVWWGFTRASAPSPPRLSLSLAERQALADAGVDLDDAAGLVAEARRWRRPLEQATGRVVLVCAALDDAGEAQFPHPLWDELGGGAIVRVLPVPRRTPAARPLPSPRVELQVSSPLALRDKESPHSLERLLGCSLAYALHYHAVLRSGLSAGPPAPGPLLQGTLAHHFLAQVFEEGALPAEAAAARAAQLLDDALDGLCESLALPRYQLERSALRHAVVESARELARVIAASGATIVGVEHDVAGELLGVRVEGTADLVLRGPDTVLDLKWGKSTNRDKLATGTALQLATYAELLRRGGERPGVGYFILREPELLVEPGSLLPGFAPGKVRADETWSGAVASLSLRRDELRAGTLRAPAAAGEESRPRLDGGRLFLPAACGFCELGGLCGRVGTT